MAKRMLTMRGVLIEALAFVLDHAEKDEDPEKWTLTRELRSAIRALADYDAAQSSSAPEPVGVDAVIDELRDFAAMKFDAGCCNATFPILAVRRTMAAAADTIAEQAAEVAKHASDCERMAEALNRMAAGREAAEQRAARCEQAPNPWADLWYFVMDEAPIEFERIVTTCAPDRWHHEAHILMRAKHPAATPEKHDGQG